jgi:hypothetical protein
MICERQIWLSAVIEALADGRALIASFDVRDRNLALRIDAAMTIAHALKQTGPKP